MADISFLTGSMKEGMTSGLCRNQTTFFFAPWGNPSNLQMGLFPISSRFPAATAKHYLRSGLKPRGELVRYDSKRREFAPFLAGISATDVMPSRDGKWVVYLGYPENRLWRSRADGSARLQLVYPPLLVENPHISPDGNRVVFGAWDRTQPVSVYVVSMLGGRLQKIAQDAASAIWSPDGNYLAFEQSGIRTIDLRTGANRAVPDSRGKEGRGWPTQDSLLANFPEGLVT